jgi:acetyl esterase/lipase
LMITERYGSNDSQVGDLYLPKGQSVGLVCLFHGGFWRMPYDRKQMSPISEDLATSGYGVWNIEYRRVDESDWNWKDTTSDAVLSINHVQELRKKYPSISKVEVVVAGHSAGGHLAILLSSEPLLVSPKRFIGLAPILDLEIAYSNLKVKRFVEDFIGGSPQEYSERYSKISPYEKLKDPAKQTVFHGERDEDVPARLNIRYVETARKMSSDFEYYEIAECEHMDFIDSSSKAYGEFKSKLGSIFT